MFGVDSTWCSLRISRIADETVMHSTGGGMFQLLSLHVILRSYPAHRLIICKLERLRRRAGPGAMPSGVLTALLAGVS